MKKVYILVLNIILALVPCVSLAAVSFTEIMYDAPGTDTKHEWVELYNSDTTAVTLVGGSGAGSWRFNDGSNHYLDSDAAIGSMVIPALGYTVLADDPATFLLDYPNFSGNLIGTAVTMSNTGDGISLINGDGTEVAAATFTGDAGAAGDGNSLSRSGSTWIPTTPTPGTQNSSGENSDEVIDPNTQGSGASSTTTKEESVKPKKIEALVKVPKRALVGVPFVVKTEVTGYSGELLSYGNFFWNMGDGVLHEEKSPVVFSHTYEYPGEYVVVFEYAHSAYDTEPVVRIEQQITVNSPGIVLQSIDASGVIEVKNTANDVRDITKFILTGSTGTVYTFPRGTILLPGRSIKLPFKITQFTQADVTSVTLKDPTEAVVSTFPQQKQVRQIPVSSVNNIKSTSIASGTVKNTVASVIGTPNIPEDNAPQKRISPLMISVIGLLGVIILGFFSFLYLKEKKTDTKTTDEEALGFTLLDE